MKKTLLTLAIALLSFGIQAQISIITTVAGNGTLGYAGDGGAATTAELNNPYGVAVDAAGNMYITDANNNVIRKVTTAGIISTFAGNGIAGYAGDGGQATAAEFNGTGGVALDAAGNVYIADGNNQRIRKVTTAGIISTFAGNGTPGYSGDGGQATAAELYNLGGVAVDAAGNMYIADYSNQRVRKVTTAGIISTFAGNGTLGYSGDGGQATAAMLNGPAGFAFDAVGNVYIADQANQRIRKVTTAGIISTFAGNGTAAYAGDGGAATAAELYNPSGVAFDAAGNVYIADFYNSRIRKVTTAGIISTFAGNGIPAYAGDGGAATAAELNYPSGMAVNAAGNMYIADQNNNCIRRVYTPGASLNFNGTHDYVAVNTGSNSLSAPYTVEAWVNPNNASATMSILSTRSPSDGSFDFKLTAGNKIHADIGNGSGFITTTADAAYNYTVGTWLHIAYVVTTSGYHIYADGNLVGSGTFSGTPLLFSSIHSIVIGGVNSTGEFFNGDIDEVRIWSRALCQGEIQNSMNAELKLPQTGLVAYYPFNEGAAGGNNSGITTLADSSGNGYNGTLSSSFALTSDTSNWVSPGAVITGSYAPAYVAPSISVSGTNTVCLGTTTTLTASGASTYTWTSGPTTAAYAVTPTVNTTYSVVGTNSVGCLSNMVVSTITVNALPTLTVTSGAVCAGNNFTITPSGANTYTYSSGTAVVTPTTTSSYSVTGTNTVTGCVSNAAVSTVTVNALPIITVNSGAICAGLSFTINPSGANTYTYSPNGPVVSPTTTSSYSVTGTSAVGCVSAAAAVSSVTVNTLPTITISGSSLVNYGSSTTLTASGASTYTWGANAGSVTTASVAVTPTVKTTYSVVGTSSLGCVTKTDSITINLNGAALNFDGVDDSVTVGNTMNSILTNKTSITVEAWVYPTSLTGSAKTIIGNYTDPLNQMQFDIRLSGNVVQFFVGRVGFGYNPAVQSAANTITLNTWQHVAGVWDGSQLLIYVNGVLQGTQSGVTGSIIATTNDIVIGGNKVPEMFVGGLDEIRVWTRALCQGEIQNNMNGELALPQTGLLAYYRFNEGVAGGNNSTVNTLADSSGNGYNGSLSNFSLTGTSSNWVAPGGVTTGSVALAFVSPNISISNPTTAICANTTTTLTANGNIVTYTWTAGPITAAFAVTPSVTTSYSVVGTNSLGCVSNTAVSTVTVNTLPTITVNSGTICTNQSFTISPGGASTYTYSPSGPVVTPTTTSSYSVTGTGGNGCVSSSPAISNVTVNSLPTITVNSGTVCAGQSFTMNPSGASTYTYSPIGPVVNPTTTASYSVTGTDGNGCVSSSPAISNVMVNSLPTVTVNSGTLCAGSSFTITPSGANTYTYAPSGPVVTPTATASYSVTGTDGNGCVTTAAAVSSVTVTSCTTGLEQFANSSDAVSVYPNPSNGSFVIEATTLTNTNVMMYDINGKLVLNQIINEKATIDATQLNSGVYNISIISNEGVVNKRIVITR